MFSNKSLKPLVDNYLASQGIKSSSAAKRTKRRRTKVYASKLPLSVINSHVNDVVLATQLVLQTQTNNGWDNGTINSQSLQFAFSSGQVQYALGSTTAIGPTPGNGTAFANLYDQYRIAKVEVEFYFTGNAGILTELNNAGLGSVSLPVVIGVIDYDDSSPLLSATAALGYSSSKTFQLGANGSSYGRQVMQLNRPTVQSVTQFTGGTSSSMFVISPWLDTDSPNTLHYGMKFWLDTDPLQPTVNQISGAVTFNFRMHLQYKNVK
jgi:hypothetical protein